MLPAIVPSARRPVDDGLCPPPCVVLAQEDLVRRMRRVGLVLVDVGSRGVRRLPSAVQDRPADDHEVGRRALLVQRVVRLERHDDRLGAGLADEVEAMVEELAEQREQGVVRGREPAVRRGVGDEERARGRIRLGARARRIDGGRVVHRLVDDQVADDARLRVLHISAAVLVVRDHGTEWRRRLGVAPRPGAAHVREELIRSAPALTTREQVVVVAGRLTQAPRQQVARQVERAVAQDRRRRDDVPEGAVVGRAVRTRRSGSA